MTYYYEDLAVGLSESMSHTVSEHDIQLFGEATGDFNPLHFDEAYAKKTIFRGRVAHGALTIGFISAVMGTKIPGPGAIFMEAVTRFKAPVRIGDTVVTTCTVAELKPRREVVMHCQCKVGDKIVVEGEALVMAPHKPAKQPVQKDRA